MRYKHNLSTCPHCFWGRVNKTGPVPPHVLDLGPCWLWTGAVTSHGYGYLRVAGGTRRATDRVFVHRHAYELAHGLPLRSIPKNIFVCHRCDTPLCVRPDHLFLGTHADNMHDKVAKGRQSQPTGLTDEDRAAIRSRYQWFSLTQKQLAEEYGVSINTIFDIVNGGSKSVRLQMKRNLRTAG